MWCLQFCSSFSTWSWCLPSGVWGWVLGFLGLLVVGAVYLPNWLLDLGCPRSRADQLVTRAGPGINKLEGGSPNSACQSQCPHGGVSSPKWLLPGSMSPVWVPIASLFLGGSPRESDLGSFQTTASALGLVSCEVLCAPFKSAVYFLQPSGTLRKPHWPSNLNILGNLSSQCKTLGLGSLMWGSDPLLLGENLCNCNYPLVCGSPTWGMGLGYTTSLPLLHACGSFLVSLVVGYLFC